MSPEVKPQRSAGFYFRAISSVVSQAGENQSGRIYMPKLFAKLGRCVYVLLSLKDGKFYVGYSTDLKQRLTDHFNGNVESTAPRRPLKLVYCEYHLSAADARRREDYFKTTAGKKALKLMLRDSLANPLL